MRGEAGIHGKVARYYSKRLREFGPQARGVDWNSEESQRLRFQKLLYIAKETAARSILDYGCGYGALVETLERHEPKIERYQGYDIATAMIEQARVLHSSRQWAVFTDVQEDLARADVVVASGIFNVRLDCGVEEWEAYIARTLDDMRALAVLGMAFNMLTAYADRERMRTDLYYADPHKYFDLCRERYSRNVALLHDYDLYEFTIGVRL